MKRRNFLKSLFPLGLFAGGFVSLNAFSYQISNNIIIKNGLAEGRFKRGIKELGGISRFVKKGDRVVIKPTMAYDKTPGAGYNSNPYLIKEIINQCTEADVKVVSIFDQAYDSWTKCYKNSGIERIAKDAYARVLPANDERFYTKIDLKNSEILKTIKIHNAILEADVIINVAAGRIESENHFLGGIKNLTGCVWNRELFESKENESCWDDFIDQIEPAVNIVDTKDFQVISNNCVSADMLALNLLNLGIESSYLKKVSVNRIDLFEKIIENTREITL